MKHLLAAVVLCSLLPPGYALEAGCEPLLNVSEAKMAQPAWHSVTVTAGLKLEAMKVDGQFFMQMDGKWQPSPMSLDEAEKIAIGQMREGTIKISDCKEMGSVTVDGQDLEVFSYRSEVPGTGMPATVAMLFIGKKDGLPYKFATEDGATKVIYRYKNVVSPTL